MAQVVAPTTANERIGVLDALRGLALFGILLANITDWSAWGWLEFEEKVAIASPTVVSVTDFLNLMLINGKFYTIFSFLFGLGFALQLSRLERRGADGKAIYHRRLALLLMFGVLHMTFVWQGDILTLYAALGFLLPLVHGWSNRKLLIGAAILLLIPIPGYALVAATGIQPDLGLKQLTYSLGDKLWTVFVGGEVPSDIDWVRHESWSAFWAWVLSSPPYRIGFYLESWRIPKVLGVMMIGVWTGRRLVDGQLLEDRGFLKRVALIGYSVGIPLNIAFASMGGLAQEDTTAGLRSMVLHSIGVVPLGLAYAATFALAWRHAPRVLGPLQAPGRMALTNYIMHSFLGVAVFYGIGFALIGRSPPSVIYGIAVGIFVLQILLSMIWLSRFKQGPLEWLWRFGTYKGRVQLPP